MIKLNFKKLGISGILLFSTIYIFFACLTGCLLDYSLDMWSAYLGNVNKVPFWICAAICAIPVRYVFPVVITTGILTYLLFTGGIL